MLKVLDRTREDNVEAADDARLTLDEVAREGARRMLAAALEAEVEQYIEVHADARDAAGRRLVVGNGRAQSRTVTCGAGTLQVRAPWVNDRRVDDEGARQRFTSRILPRICVVRRRWPRSCPCCICAACRRATSGKRWRCCWARTRRA